LRFVKALLAASVLAVVAVPNALAFRWDDAARMPPTGVTGQPYSHALGTVAGCKGVYMDVMSGSLPPGLRLVGDKRDDVDGSNWRIEGTPTTPGEYGFYLRARNLCPVDSTEEDFKIVVVSGLAIQQNGVPLGRVGTPYSYQLTAAGGGGQTWSVAAGALPAGLTLGANGVLSGTPTAEARAQSVTFAVTDGSRRATKTIEISIRAQLAAAATPAVVPATQVDKPFSFAGLKATGGSGTYRWSIASGRLPTGVNFDPATAALSGTPTVAGSFRVVFRVDDGEGQIKDLPLVIQVASPVSITTRRFAVLRIGRFYTLQVKTLGGVPILRSGLNTMNWKVVGGKLPLGLRLNTRTGKLIGTPRKAGAFRFTIEVTDKFRSTARQSFQLTVKKT
jgi:hypothetical protein